MNAQRAEGEEGGRERGRANVGARARGSPPQGERTRAHAQGGARPRGSERGQAPSRVRALALGRPVSTDERGGGWRAERNPSRLCPPSPSPRFLPPPPLPPLALALAHSLSLPRGARGSAGRALLSSRPLSPRRPPCMRARTAERMRSARQFPPFPPLYSPLHPSSPLSPPPLQGRERGHGRGVRGSRAPAGRG